jgi:uncharacterized phage protein gp47/JayE
MPYKAPTAVELSQALRAAIRAELPTTDPAIWPNNLYVVTKAIAQALRAYYIRLEYIHRQARVVTADSEFLELHGADIGIARLAGLKATGTATAVTTAGTQIPVNTRLRRTDDVVLLVSSTVVATGASTSVGLVAAAAGKAGNTAAGAVLELETPIAGVGAVTVDADGVTGGAEIENDAALRSRILLARRNPPHGGSPNEYIGWARKKPGVTRVYVLRATPEPGAVTIVFLMDDAFPETNGIPTTTHVDDLKARLETLAPANAQIHVKAPVPVTINITASVSPNTSAVQAAATTEIQAMFRRRAEPGSTAKPFTFSRSWISEAIAMATGELRHTVTAPAADVVLTETGGVPQFPVLGTITWS